MWSCYSDVHKSINYFPPLLTELLATIQQSPALICQSVTKAYLIHLDQICPFCFCQVLDKVRSENYNMCTGLWACYCTSIQFFTTLHRSPHSWQYPICFHILFVFRYSQYNWQKCCLCIHKPQKLGLSIIWTIIEAMFNQQAWPS